MRVLLALTVAPYSGLNANDTPGSFTVPILSGFQVFVQHFLFPNAISARALSLILTRGLGILFCSLVSLRLCPKFPGLCNTKQNRIESLPRGLRVSQNFSRHGGHIGQAREQVSRRSASRDHRHDHIRAQARQCDGPVGQLSLHPRP